MTTYTPDPNKIVHQTSVDFNSRTGVPHPIHVVQYDTRQVIAEVKLYNIGQTYVLPEGVEANIRLGKPDGTSVYNKALGTNTTRDTLYFEITKRMTEVKGTLNPVVELTLNNGVAGSAAFPIIVDKNPISDQSLKSSSEFEALADYVDAAQTAAAAAAGSASDADTSAEEAKASQEAAKASENQASSSAAAAAESARQAKASEDAASGSATAAASSASNADESETQAKHWEELSESYAHGQSGAREGEENDNAMYYYDQAKKISQSISGALKPMGTIPFATLKTLKSSANAGDMYNINEAFDSDEDFEDGGNKHYGAGSNVYYTSNLKWDVLAATVVSGVKGEAEDVYRQGDVNITKENIGLETAAKLPAIDTTGLLGSLGASSNTQALIDEIADRVIAKLATKQELTTALSTTWSFTGGTSIPVGADLKSETYLVPGNYYCALNDVAGKLVNAPMAQAFTLKVYYSAGNTTYITQDFLGIYNSLHIRRGYEVTSKKWINEVTLDPTSLQTQITTNTNALATLNGNFMTAYIDPSSREQARTLLENFSHTLATQTGSRVGFVRMSNNVPFTFGVLGGGTYILMVCAMNSTYWSIYAFSYWGDKAISRAIIQNNVWTDFVKIA